MKNWAQLAADFQNVKVLVVGDIMLDRYWWGSVSRISPEAPVPVVKLEKITLTAGGAANVAANVSGLGAGCFLIGLIGKDAGGTEIRHLVKKANINTDYLIETTERPTITKTRVIAQHQQVSRIDEELTHFSSESELNDLQQAFDTVLPQVNIVVISDYAKGCLSKEFLEYILAQAGNQKKPVLVDPKGVDFQRYNGATLLTPNKHEALRALADSKRDKVTAEEIGDKLLKKLHVQHLLITLGEDGMLLFTKTKEPFHIPAEVRKVYDVTGAGDTVIATIAVALGAKLSMPEAAALANFAAGSVIEKLGTTAITMNDLLNAPEMETPV